MQRLQSIQSSRSDVFRVTPVCMTGFTARSSPQPLPECFLPVNDTIIRSDYQLNLTCWIPSTSTMRPNNFSTSLIPFGHSRSGSKLVTRPGAPTLTAFSLSGCKHRKRCTNCPPPEKPIMENLSVRIPGHRTDTSLMIARRARSDRNVFGFEVFIRIQIERIIEASREKWRKYSTWLRACERRQSSQ